jgi:hypothetical protein
MASKYIVAVNIESSQEIISFANYLKSLGYGWWHKVGTCWVITPIGNVSLGDMRDLAHIYFPNSRLIVIEMIDAHWTGWGSDSDFSWFHTNWD